MVHGVPESSRPSPLRDHRRPADAVLFDFHGTIAQVEDPVDWVVSAAWTCGVAMDPAQATGLADRLVTAGRAGGPLPTRVPPHLMEVWAERDLSPHAHRAAYEGLAETVDTGIDGLATALYDRLLRPEGWRLYPDTLSTLQALRGAGVAVAVVSNIGFDLRPLAAELGFAEYVDAWALSCDLGRCKPDPAVFTFACAALGADPGRTLMVGDTPADADAVGAGCRAFVLPAAPAGEPNDLSLALNLALG
ncbi:HAD-IA family hydrolase [Luedemannella flava]|uniref:HAD-IA family hydrolase n=1 Tax=Luedemannella flava TaxID=349316 RepID=A0ABN2LMD7_9ACTN